MNTKQLNKPELLLPGGSLQKIETAILYGADAVYSGLPDISLRAAVKMTNEELAAASEILHKAGKKLYLTANVFSKNSDAALLDSALNAVKMIKPDGLIISDLGIFNFFRENLSEMPLHISTQANTNSYLAANAWHKLGASQIVYGRETSYQDLREIKANTSPDLKTEIFIHGAMCISFSGRCLMSAFMTNRSANRGECAQACRWKYNTYIEEESRPGELMELTEDTRGAYIMNSKDLCLVSKLPEIINLGIDSLKIEGRNKSEYYAGIAARAYRAAIDDYIANPDTWSSDIYFNELQMLQNRGYTLGFWNGSAANESIEYGDSRPWNDYRYCGQVVETLPNGVIIEPKHTLQIGDTLEFLSPTRLEPFNVKISELKDFDKNMKDLDRATVNMTRIFIPTDAPELFPPRTLARIKIN
jgi:putative protease